MVSSIRLTGTRPSSKGTPDSAGQLRSGFALIGTVPLGLARLNPAAAFCWVQGIGTSTNAIQRAGSGALCTYYTAV